MSILAIIRKYIFTYIKCSSRARLTAGDTGSGFVRASSPPCGDRCPQAFSRLQDSRSYYTISHYSNVRSWPTRHVFSCMYRLVNVLSRTEGYASSYFHRQTYQHSLGIYLLTAPSRYRCYEVHTQGHQFWTYTSHWLPKSIQHRLDHSTTLPRKSRL